MDWFCKHCAVFVNPCRAAVLVVFGSLLSSRGWLTLMYHTTQTFLAPSHLGSGEQPPSLIVWLPGATRFSCVEHTFASLHQLKNNLLAGGLFLMLSSKQVIHVQLPAVLST